MLLELDRPLIVFDLETTGTNFSYDRIVEIAAVKLHPDGRRDTLEMRLNPGRPIPAEVTAIHGIADADVADKPSFADVAGQVLGFFANCDLAGFNAARFDIPMLVQEFARNGMSFSVASARVVDAQKIFHMREPRTLSAALRFYCGEEHVDAHGALADVEATIKVLDGQCERYTDLPRSVVELDQVCNPRPPDALDPEGKIAWRDNEAVMNFGQKKGIPLRTMAADEPSYLRWMLNKSFSEEAKQLVRDALDGRFPTRKSST